MRQLTALPIVVPFITAALLVILRPFGRRGLNDAISASGAVAVLVLCVMLLVRAVQHPIAYWIGPYDQQRPDLDRQLVRPGLPAQGIRPG